MHWEYKEKPDLSQFGFVYIITNLKNNKAYIGCKQYFNYKKTKKKSESNWKSYMGSSKHLLEDIEKIGFDKPNMGVLINHILESSDDERLD